MAGKNYNGYLDEHHNTLEAQLSFNIIDYLVFTEITYLDLGEFVPESLDPSDAVLLRDVAAHFYLRKDRFKKANPSMTRAERVKAMGYLYHAKRYEKVKIFGHSNIVDTSKNIQFSATTFQIRPDEFVLVYRGTDDNIVGWKEDFYLAISDQVPAQEEALNYLQKLYKHIPNGKIIITGHSKGGNLAMYASILVERSIQENIKEVHAFDPVGFNKNLIQKLNKIDYNFPINRYIPEESYVGMMMYYPVPYKVVKSRQLTFSQHATEHWLVEGNDFVYTDEIKGQGKVFNTILTSLSEQISHEDFKRTIDIIFDYFEQGNLDSINRLFTNPIQTINDLSNASDEMDAADNELVTKVLKIVWDIASQEVSQSVERDLEKSYQQLTTTLNKNWQQAKGNVTTTFKKGLEEFKQSFDKKDN